MSCPEQGTIHLPQSRKEINRANRGKNETNGDNHDRFLDSLPVDLTQLLFGPFAGLLQDHRGNDLEKDEITVSKNDKVVKLTEEGEKIGYDIHGEEDVGERNEHQQPSVPRSLRVPHDQVKEVPVLNNPLEKLFPFFDHFHDATKQP